MIGNIIMSPHAFYFELREDILEEKSWSLVRFKPLTSGMASRRANHWATELRFENDRINEKKEYMYLCTYVPGF